MAHSVLKRLLSRRFLPVAVFFSYILFTGAMFIQPRFLSPLPPAYVDTGLFGGPDDVFPVLENVVAHGRNPVLQRMEEMILAERTVSVSV